MKRRPARPARSASTLRRLRRRLQEAEETLTAIREGHVDALIVDSPTGEQVFTLRSADQPYRLMVEQMREGALTLAADGTILYCNGRFAELVGQRPEVVTGQPIDRFVVAENRGPVQQMLAADTYRGEFQLQTAGGLVRPTQLSATAMHIDGVRTVAVVATDLTHERVERGLRESNRLKDEFLATLSHELRTPLNVILGWTRMLLSDHLDARLRQHALALIDRNAQAQAQLVNDLVDMSRLTTGKVRLDLEPLPIAPILENALASVRPEAEVKGLQVTTSWDIPNVRVNADATRLQQVLWNLLSNAVKFTPIGGRIDVTASSDDHLVRIQIADSGIGIDRAFLPHVFDRFRQADSGTTRAYGGLGLGLAIVHELVERHHGTVDVHSGGVGQGTTFTVALPTTAARPRRVERRAASRPSASLAGRRVLVLEDHPDSRELLATALENAGAAVAAFDSAGEAFNALDHLRPSVIVADIGLPGENGYSFIQRVRTAGSDPVRTIPAVAVTAYATAADRKEALAAGFQQHLAKPIDPEDLVDAVHRLIRADGARSRR